MSGQSQSPYKIIHIRNIGDLLTFQFHIDRVVFILIQDQGLINHAFIMVQQGKSHVEVDEGFRLIRKFLDKYMFYGSAACQLIYQGIYRMDRCPGTNTDNQGILGKNQNIPSFNGDGM